MAASDDSVRWMRRNACRVAVAVGGAVLIVVGVALLALPGPGMVVIVAGLALLAREFSWARSGLAAARRRVRQTGESLRRRTSRHRN